MNILRNTLHQIAADNAAAIAQPCIGIIQSVDPLRHLARVTVQPDNVLSGWLPLATPVIGWQMLPAIGSQAVIVPRDGDKRNGVIVAYAYSNPNPPPQVPNAIGTGGTPNASNTPMSGTESVLTGPSGAALRFCADGSVYIKAALHLDGPLIVNGPITSTHGDITTQAGNITASGDLNDYSGTRGTVDALRTAYDAHKHSGVQSGGSSTSTTDHPV